MKKYSSYKPSGIDWIGDIPEHWVLVTTNKIFNNLGSGTTPKSENEEYYDNGKYYWITTSDLNEGVVLNTLNKLTDKTILDYPTLKLYPPNSIFISMYGGKIGKIGISNFSSYCNQSVCVLPSNENNETMFYYWWFLGFQEQVKSMGRGGGQPNINKDMIKEFPVCKIPLSEQLQIVQFLDEKTEIIDKLISTKERKIDLLKRQRTSLINEVITKGLNPTVKMKDSGVEWIGEIPEHWRIIKIKYVGQINSGDTIQSNLIETEGKYPVYGGNGIMGYYNEFNFSHSVLSIGRVGEKCGNVHLISEKCWINDNSLVLDKKNQKIKLFYLFQSIKTRDLNIIRNQNTQPLITGTMVKNETIPFPPIQEQQQIVDYLDTRTKEIDELVSLEQRKMEVLKQYRQSLISEVVTGKIDVRTTSVSFK